MHIYKFRILSEEQNDFVRDIEISSNQTFEDLHKSILKTTGLEGKELASFHITNGRWIKLKEITLIDMMDGRNVLLPEHDDDEEKSIPETCVMKDCKLKDFVDDPHQRLIYEYDFLHMKTFYIELIQISQAKSNVKYPVCTRSIGELEIKKKPAVPGIINNNEIPEDMKPEDLNADLFFAEDDEDEDEFQSNINLELDDGFEEFRPL